MRSKYLFYFCEGIGSVFDSQVLTLLNTLDSIKSFSKIFLFLGVRNADQKNHILTKSISKDIQIVFFKAYPNYPLFNYHNRDSIRKVLYIKNINFSEVIFHTRGEMIAWHLIKILNKDYHKQIIPDVRGASIEEVEEYYKLHRIFKLLKIKNLKVSIKNLNYFCKISVVSNSLKEYLITNYKIESKKIAVTPCLSGANFRLNESERLQIRNELKLRNDDMLIVYSSGGTADWQNDSILYILAEKGLKVLNLSKNKIQHHNIINKFANYSEMPVHLNAADLAVIWRDESVVNKVASPVKFSEFICCGLPVIANNSVDMIRDYLTNHRCGALFDRIENIEMNTLINLKLMDRKKISETGILNFGVNKIASQYDRLYKEISDF